MRGIHEVLYTAHSGGNTPVWLLSELNQLLFHGIPFCLKKLTDSRNCDYWDMDICQMFSQNDCNDSISSRKTTDSICCPL